MKKLRTVLAGILLTLPLFALNASPSLIESEALEVQDGTNVTGWCLVFFMGYWMVVPC
jgi:hypothetical protein